MSGDGIKTKHPRWKRAAREPSTWAGLASIGAVFAGIPPEVAAAAAKGVFVAVQEHQGWAAAVSAVVSSGLLAVLLPEKGAGA